MRIVIDRSSAEPSPRGAHVLRRGSRARQGRRHDLMYHGECSSRPTVTSRGGDGPTTKLRGRRSPASPRAPGASWTPRTALAARSRGRRQRGRRPASDLYGGAGGHRVAARASWVEGYVDAERAPLRRGPAEKVVAEPSVPEPRWAPGAASPVCSPWLNSTGPTPRAGTGSPSCAATCSGSPALDPMVGHPGHWLSAELHERTARNGGPALVCGAERLLGGRSRRAQAWLNAAVGRRRPVISAPLTVSWATSRLLRDPLAGGASRRRAARGRHAFPARRGGGAAAPIGPRSPATTSPSAGRIRVQWCHGAPGVLTCMWDAAPDDDAWSELLLAAGRLLWEAGPIRAHAGLCHGTAGNAYALLALWRRTGDELWLERARAFAWHAAGQAEARAARLGHGWHSVFTGDEGVALCPGVVPRGGRADADRGPPDPAATLAVAARR